MNETRKHKFCPKCGHPWLLEVQAPKIEGRLISNRISGQCHCLHPLYGDIINEL